MAMPTTSLAASKMKPSIDEAAPGSIIFTDEGIVSPKAINGAAAPKKLAIKIDDLLIFLN